MRFIKIPSFYVPEQALDRVFESDEEVEQHQHPLQLCPECNYVLCSCGSCHHRGCSQDRECTA
jgi:hypothetical protein